MNIILMAILKILFYPVHIISYEKYNFTGFLVFLVVMFLVGFTPYLFIFIVVSLCYLLLGQHFNAKLRGTK